MEIKPDFEGNLLFPVFFRLDKLRLLVVGGGAVGLEKTAAVFKSSPNAHVTLVAPEIRDEIKTLSQSGIDLTLICQPFSEIHLENIDLVIIATADRVLNESVYKACKVKGIITNVADSPDICDFYLGSIVKKGDLKIGISTNGKSPTFAKRFRELLEDVLPDTLQDVLDNLKEIRDRLKGDFEHKLNRLNEITSVMNSKEKKNNHE